jgi:hypothetical protein
MMEIEKLLQLLSLFQQMVELYHPCISTRGLGIYWDGMLACNIQSQQHLHGQLKPGLTMNWNWNEWNRTLRNMLLRCLYDEIGLQLRLTITVQWAHHVF